MRRLDLVVADLPPGNALRWAIAQRYAGEGLAVDPQQIIITTGAMEALSLSLQVLTEPGDWVVVESTFYGALQAIERLKLKAVEIPVLPGIGIDLALLEDALARMPIKACWLMGNVQHPLGHTMPDAHKQGLMALLRAHKVPLVEDDVYAEVYFGRERPKPIRHWDQRGDIAHKLLFQVSGTGLSGRLGSGGAPCRAGAAAATDVHPLHQTCRADWRWPRCCARVGSVPTFAACATPWSSASS